MASLSKDGSGWRIQFVCPDGKRPTIRLPKGVTKADADSLRIIVEALLVAKQTNTSVDMHTAKRIAELTSFVRQKLEAVGLVERLETATLGSFVEEYIAKRQDTAARNTLRCLGDAKKAVVRYFGAEKRMDAVTEQDARDYRLWLEDPAGANWSEATASRRCKYAKQFFEAARRARLIPSNPFESVRMGSQKNEKRMEYIPKEIIGDVLNACPNDRWRLMVALARFAALRVPSEICELRWSGVNWEKSRMEVYSPKTKTARIIPIWPEVKEYLDREFFNPDRQGDLIFEGMDLDVNLRTRFRKIIRRAGHEPWERLFQNLRASGATDISNQFPSHVAAKWCGHTEEIARAHYRQTIEAHFDKAAGEKVTQNPAYSASELDCTGAKGEGGLGAEVGKTPDFSPSCTPLHQCTDVQLRPVGIEPTTYGLEVRCSVR